MIRFLKIDKLPNLHEYNLESLHHKFWAYGLCKKMASRKRFQMLNNKPLVQFQNTLII